MHPQNSLRPLLIILAVFSTSMIVDCAAAEERGQWTAHQSSWNHDGELQVQTTDYHKIQGFEVRPKEESLKSITVQWQKPEMDQLGKSCTIRGQVSFQDPKTGRQRPVKWFQGIAIYLSIAPKMKLDWSKGINDEDTIQQTALIDATGEFHVRCKLEDFSHDRNALESFQVGLALAKHSEIEGLGEQVEWSTATAAIPNSVVMLDFPEAPALEKELALINAARGWPFGDPNGVALIRAVNALHSLGKEQSLATLKKYLEILEGSGGYDDDKIVFWIIRVLFEPIRIDQEIPGPGVAIHLPDRNLAEAARWPLNPIVIVGDIPFMVGRQCGLGGMEERPESHILWARRHGTLREAPLKPTMDPRDAAEALITMNRFKKLNEFDRTRAEESFKIQAATMVEYAPETAGNAYLNQKRARDMLMQEKSPARGTDEYRWDSKKETFVEIKK